MHDESLDEVYAESGAQLDRLAILPPGPELAAALVELQSVPVSEADAVRVVAQWTRQRAWTDAQAMRALSDATATDESDAPRLVIHEVAAMTHISEMSTGSEMGLMLQVRDRLPLCWEALNAGTVALAHVKALAAALAGATRELSKQVEAAVLPQAIAEGWTPAQLRRAARRALMAADPDGAADRAEKAKEISSDVRLYGEDNEMASLIATGDAVTARAVMDAIESRAAGWKTDGDARPIGVLRVAALAQLVLGEQAAKPPVQLLVQIDLATLLGLSRQPGELAGYGPISDETARALAGDATWRRLITDPLTHATLDLGHQAYRPTASLRRFIQARDQTCRFPGCTRRAIRCDLDHAVDFDERGPTNRANLHALCRTHHNLKTEKLWRVDRHPDGSETWTSRFGYSYTRAAPVQPVTDLTPPDDPYPMVECPGVYPIDAETGDGIDEDNGIPPGDPPPLDNEDREHAEHLIEAALWARFDEACYANYWQDRAAA
ncbi:MAG TPA: DUF222 domain-containing protein [Mycobacteriales bacterium]|jgi:hypothetical protein|nr:DUF222 domain-containing protein [Mycobacteriales bacterium]